MEIFYGGSNWKLTVRREADHVKILRAETCDTHASLPDELFGLPVTVLGEKALSPTAKPVNGEEVRIVCGREGEWDNRNLQELTLPEPLLEVQNYALYGCRGLQTLRLSDRIRRWGGGCLTNCRSLYRVELTRVAEKQGESLAVICGELSDELDVTILEQDGSTVRLLFPEYAELFEENIPHHQFDYHIQGGGFPYHHTFPGKQLSLRTYDDGVFDYMAGKLQQIARQVEADTGCSVQIRMNDSYPAVMNPKETLEKVRTLVDVGEIEKPGMVAEDFSFYQRRVKAVFFFLGVGDTPALHANTFQFDESVLLKGAELFETLAEKFR